MKYGFDSKEERRLKKIVLWLIAFGVIAVIYFTWQTVEKSKVYYVEKRPELAVVADTSNIPFGIMMKVGAMPWEDIVWNDETKMLHMTIRNSTGTITNAEELRSYHMTPSGMLQGGDLFGMREIRGLLAIRIEHEFENDVLTLIDERYQKELCQIDLSEVLKDGQTVSGLSIGYMSDITISKDEKIQLYITPGYQIEGIVGKIFYKNMPTLKADISWEYDDDRWAVYEIGALDVAWMNEENDAILTRITDIDKNGLFYDEVEWVNVTGTRATELDLHMGNVPSGIYIYNELEEIKEAVFSPECEFLAVDGINHDKLICLSKEQMVRRVKRERDEKMVYYLVIEGGEIVKLQEQYVTKH